jgi:hypothetical protein
MLQASIAKWPGECRVEWFDLLLFAAKRFDELGIRYFVTGSCATITYGEARLTQEIDIVAALEHWHIAPICQKFPFPEFQVLIPLCVGRRSG